MGFEEALPYEDLEDEVLIVSLERAAAARAGYTRLGKGGRVEYWGKLYLEAGTFDTATQTQHHSQGPKNWFVLRAHDHSGQLPDFSDTYVN